MIYTSAERSWTNVVGAPRARMPFMPESPIRGSGSPNWRHLRACQGNVDAQYARSVVVQWLANGLLADAMFLNDGFVAFGIRLSEVIEQTATPAHHHEKTAPGGMVLLMRLEMLRQFANPCAQDGNLNFRGAGIVIVSPVLFNQGGFFLSG